TTLSGGEQTKVKLAQLTMNQGNLLILDEPTNHIDQETKESLQGIVFLSATEEQTLISIIIAVTSAFGTTGLSLGITGDLSVVGK
ncbi:ATP-binding cassette domain-containing protein, partial [Enterococcus faecium]|uniref:ATP-binding cassette domain-containing protein n=1 Tax=Enterococcus faecium TaxID=1352 RepID=UPI0037BEA061